MIDRETLIARIDFFTAECERDHYTDTGEAHAILAEIREALAVSEDVAPKWEATFRGQAWINNHAIDVDDATFVYPVTAEEVNEAGGADAGDLDALQTARAAPAVVREWWGPFEISARLLA